MEEDKANEPRGVKPHRGGVILTMGILTLVFAFCCPFLCWMIGGIGENMAGKDLRLMSRGEMDGAGLGQTRTGKTLMDVGLVLSILLWIGLTILRYTAFRRH
jgi:hypothetical protein